MEEAGDKGCVGVSGTETSFLADTGTHFSILKDIRR